jgi:hypothetical protein
MAVRVQVSGYPRVLDPTGAGSFLHPRVEPAPDPHITRFRCGFCFSPTGAPETRKEFEKTLKPKKTQKEPKQNLKTLKPEEKPDRNPKTPERNTFIKPDGHLNLTRNPMGSGASFQPWVRVWVSNSTRLHFFMGRVFSQPDPNLTHCRP